MKLIQIKVLLNFTFCTHVDHKCRWYYGQNWVAWSACYDFFSFLLERWEIITNSWSTGRAGWPKLSLVVTHLPFSCWKVQCMFPFFSTEFPEELRLSLINAEMRTMQTVPAGFSLPSRDPHEKLRPQGSWREGGNLQYLTPAPQEPYLQFLRNYDPPQRILYVNMLPTDCEWGWKVLYGGSIQSVCWKAFGLCDTAVDSYGKDSLHLQEYHLTWLNLMAVAENMTNYWIGDWLMHERLCSSGDLDGGSGSLPFFVSTASSRVSQLMPLLRSREEALKHPLWSLQGRWEPSESSEQRYPLGSGCFTSLERSVTQFPHSF